MTGSENADILRDRVHALPPAGLHFEKDTIAQNVPVLGPLLAVHAHPDDETLFSGALIAAWAASGSPVTVVTCTRGERGEVIALPGTASEGMEALEGDGPALAAYRTQELRAALDALGSEASSPVRSVFLDQLPAGVMCIRPCDVHSPRIGAQTGQKWANPANTGESTAHEHPTARFEDSGYVTGPAGEVLPEPEAAQGFCFVELDDAAARLAALIRAERPAVVVTYEWTGGYGHPDHKQVHRVTVRALELAADPTWTDGAGDGTPHAPALWQRVPSAEEADLDAAWNPIRPLQEERIATYPASECVEVEVAPVLPQVLAALRAHATQVLGVTATWKPQPGEPLGYYALSHNLMTPIQPVETYLVSAAATAD